MWRAGTELFGRRTLGVHVGLAAPLGRSVVHFVAATSPTLRAGLEQAVRYQRLVTRNADTGLSPHGELTLLTILPRLPPAAVPFEVLDYAVAGVVRTVRELTGKPVREAWLPHEPLAPRDEYERALGVPVRFAAARAGVLLDPATLDTPCRRSDPHLFELLRSHAELLLARQPEDASERGRAYRVVVRMLSHGEPDVGLVARELGTSARSLQRRLKLEHTSFRQVLDDARCELARAYLTDKRLPISEIAYLLGYAEAGAFVRAFKRWTGQTPSEARAGSRSGAGGLSSRP
jgi:AraC-like DNA-binding protein